MRGLGKPELKKHQEERPSRRKPATQSRADGDMQPCRVMSLKRQMQFVLHFAALQTGYFFPQFNSSQAPTRPTAFFNAVLDTYVDCVSALYIEGHIRDQNSSRK